MEETSFKWWIDRIKWSHRLYDVIRIDHFRGFDEFYAINYNSKDVKNGVWIPAKGRELFDAVKLNLGEISIIAEDLGFITESVKELIKFTGFLKMKVLQFAFDGDKENPYLPQNYEENSVCFTGTHDNDTLKGWFEKLNISEKDYVLKSLNIIGDFKEIGMTVGHKDELNNSLAENSIYFEIIKKLYESKSIICILPIQDFLCLGSEGRINVPSTVGSNWRWRLKDDILNNELALKIKDLTLKSGR
jgi:4-alpha-glucanotransferase